MSGVVLLSLLLMLLIFFLILIFILIFLWITRHSKIDESLVWCRSGLPSRTGTARQAAPTSDHATATVRSRAASEPLLSAGKWLRTLERTPAR